MTNKFLNFLDTPSGHAIGCGIGFVNIIFGITSTSLIQVLGGLFLFGIEGYDLYRKLKR